MAVQGMEDVRSSLAAIMEKLQDDPDAVVRFGRHRREEAVVLSSARYAQLVAAARHTEELERLGAMQVVRDRLEDGRFTEGTVEDLFAAADASR